jgi:hypothetical protein
MRTWKTWCCGIVLAMLAACGGGGGGATSGSAANPPAATATLAVTVIDNLGRFVPGATISTGAAEATTDASGHATIAVAAGVEQVLTIDTSGFAEQVKVVNLPAGATAGALRAMVIPRQPAAAIAAIENGGTATGRHGVSVTFPAGALIDGSGRAVTGAVDLLMTPVDVTDVDVEAFPGLFEGIPTGASRTGIVSYGTSELVPTQGGAKLALAAGKTAQIELPVYVTKHVDGSAVKAGDTIALWSLDTSTGLWKQEGSASVVANAASPTGLALRATIAHFSWWNGDAVSGRATVQLTVTAGNANVPAGTSAPVDATVVAGSGPASTATTSVTVGTPAALTVPANATVRFRTRFDLPTQTCTGSVDVATPAASGSVSATLAATCIDVPIPTIVRPADLSATNSASDTTVDIDVAGHAPDSVELRVDGTTVAQMPAQFFYRAFWHSAAFAEGTHTLVAVATLNGVSRSSPGVQVVVDRTPPQVAGIAPSASTDVDQSTVFTVDFDEPVNALPFGLATAVQFTVTPIGQNTPVVVPADIALDAAGLRLTVQPTAPLPLGTAGLSWAGLQDAAGNAVTGTIAATWNVQRFQAVDSFLYDRDLIAMTVDETGTPWILSPRRTDGMLQVTTLRGGTFVAVGPTVNDRPSTGDASIVVRNGQVWVAFSQADAAGTGSEIFVRHLDPAGTSWLTPGTQAFAVARAASARSSHPHVDLDAQGLPTLAFIGSTAGQFDLQGFRFDGTNWIPLGTFGTTIFGNMTMRLDPNGHPVVAQLRGFGGSNAAQLQVVRHDGNQWVLLATLDSTPDATQGLGEPLLALDANGQPWVAWKHAPFAGIRMQAFDGSVFNPVVVPADFDTESGIGFAFLNGDPVIAGTASNGSVDVRRFHAGAWEDPVFVPPASQTGSIFLLPSGRTLLVGMAGIAGLGLMERVLYP